MSNRSIHSKLWLLILFCCIALHPASKASEISRECGKSIKTGIYTQVVFINGILNDRADACASADELVKSLKSNGIDTDKINWDFVHNPTDWVIGDINELRVQAEMSALAQDRSSGSISSYYSALGWIYKDLIKEGPIYGSSPANVKIQIKRIAETTNALYEYILRKVSLDGMSLILVPHSQGNFYVEAVYGILKAEGREDVINRIRVVGVATISMRSPNDTNVTIEQDVALFDLQSINTFFISNYSPSKPLYKACEEIVYNSTILYYPEVVAIGECTDTGELKTYATRLLHEFVDVYLNVGLVDANNSPKRQLPAIISDKVAKFIAQLSRVPDVGLINPANGHRYQVITCGTWSQCRDAAIARGGSLVTIRNQAENDWLATNMLQQAKPDFAVWIGFTDAGHEGNWTWASGEVKPYSNWYPGEPSNSGNVENYAIIYNSGEYKDKWNDVQNDYPYVTKAVVEYPSSVPSSSTWNAVADYSLALNPNGAWSYGYQSQTSSIAPMLVTNVNCADIGMDCWKISALAPDIPMVAINRSGATIVKRTVVVPTGVLVLHPGMNGERAVVSWAAPTDGNYKIVGQFDIVDVIPSGVQVFVTEDTTQLISANLSRRLMSQQINLTRTLTKGQIISFSVDSAGNYGNDSTSLSVTITKSVGGGAITVLANTIPGATVTVPSGASSCSFVSTGTWSAGPQAPSQYQNADGVIGGTSYNLTNFGVPIPSAPNMALVVKHSSSGNWDLLGSNKTISVVAGETLSFMMNDATTFGYTDGNTGQLSTVWSCN